MHGRLHAVPRHRRSSVLNSRALGWFQIEAVWSSSVQFAPCSERFSLVSTHEDLARNTASQTATFNDDGINKLR
ncbi:hypothetical protein AVEN_49104-1 [Araneus ventricosus]|uniref:Uncharacterized protein n=1 Tax=Araneus ventricosus TaxID=182803 RepID=A0A4Y2C1H0_ARAVE|nr:hypothetical protein AVEN_49104-1 [Araneus ventricosus]